MSKWMYVVGAVLIAGFGALGFSEMVKARTPYVTSIAEVRVVKDRPLQFMGALVQGKSHYDESTNELVFQVKDKKGETMTVRFLGVKPANFDSAKSVVVRGTYRGGKIRADQVLVKCPSRYRGR